jgi:hypothetical protein
MAVLLAYPDPTMRQRLTQLGQIKHHAAAPRRFRRHGGITLWTILMIPALLILICFVVEIGNLWYGRVQAETSLEAAALAAVKKWGDDSTLTDTKIPRCHGVEYARVNPAGGEPVSISPNYGTVNINGNTLDPGGNLIFGAITNNEAPWVFNANVKPSCGAGAVLFDASKNGRLWGPELHEWGIAYQRPDATPVTTRITEIQIYLGAGTPLYFNRTKYGLSNLSDEKVDDQATHSQVDIFGFPDAANQIQAAFTEPLISDPDKTKRLTFSFLPDTNTTSGDQGFDVCDRFRFGASVEKANSDSPFNGDQIGKYGVTVIVTFSDGKIRQGSFVDTRSNTPPCTYLVDPTINNCSNSIIIHPHKIPDLPCPPNPGQGNNPDGQSYVRIGGSGGDKFAVLAQAEVPIPTLCENLFGFSLPKFKVQVSTFAMYDCSEPGNPRLIRVLPGNYTPPAASTP